MNKLLRISAMAALFGVAGMASADPVETKGGIKIKTEDGRFEASIGGRIHFDVNLLREDDNAPFGSSALQNNGGTYFRRIYLTLKGKAYGWNYKIEPDFAPNTTSNATTIAFQDVYISTTLGPGEIFIGQIKPFRAMTELTSSNDLTFIERPTASANGIFKNREFQQGVFYRADFFDMLTAGAGYHSLRSNNTAITEGTAGTGRVTFAPFHNDGAVLHTGVSYSYEKPQAGTLAPSFSYGGRQGPTLSPEANAVVPATSPANRPTKTLGLELAGAFGPVYAQAEYMQQKQDLRSATTGTESDVGVDAWYAETTVFITGETKPYKFKEGVFTTPKPNHDFGAIELGVRYEEAKGKDESGLASNNFCQPAVTDGGSAFTAAGTPKCELKQLTFGANWYVNPNLRFMLNYVIGEVDLGLVGHTNAAGVPNDTKDKPKAIVLRTQFAF